ncbi:MAG: MipA/OmpV family protein, partial [Betaproteobacteria bacterium]
DRSGLCIQNPNVMRLAVFRSKFVVLAVVALAAATNGVLSYAEQRPLWEAGAGLTVLDFPDYRGSDERHTLVLPLPYLVYRGDFLKAERGSVRGQFYKDDRLDLDISLNGSIPVKSDDNSARRGMSNLDPTLEIGPNLTVTLLRSPTMHLNLRLPLRAVIATDFSHVRDEGWVFQPQINVDFRDRFPGTGWNLGFAAGPLFGNKRYHAYYYGVPSQFALPDRPAYEAPAGYGGLQFIGALSKRFPSYWVGAFVRADTVSGAVFEDSPLVRQKQSFAAGLAFAWIFGRSENMVEVEE